MLNRRTALKIQVCVSAFGQFNNLLFTGKRQVFAERGFQVAFQKADVPSLTLLEAGVNAVHECECSDGGESGL